MKNKNVNIWYLLRYLKGYYLPVIATFLFLILGRVASALDPIWLKKIIDGVTQGSTLAALTKVFIIYFGIRALTFIFDYLRDFIFAPTEMGIAKTLSKELFHHLLHLPISYHVDQKIGGLSRKITRGSRSVTFMLDIIVINILPTFVELILVTALLLKLYSPAYGLITFGTIIVYTYFTVWSTEKRQKYRLGANLADDDVSGLEVDALNNIDTVKYFNNEREIGHRYEPLVFKRYKLSVASNKMFALISLGQGAIILVGLGAILMLALKQTLARTLTIGDLVLLTTYIARLSAPIGVLGFIYRQMKDGLADLDGMAKILNEDITISEPEKPKSIFKPKGEVVFDNVSFDYANQRKIYQDLNFKILPGQKVAFVGPSGVGKSTIVKLLFRLFEPANGQILIDGINLSELSKETRRHIFAIVPQEPALFNTTIEENIRFGKPKATDSEIKAAAKLAAIDNFIEHLPQKYQTVVGERGVKLSGGEKQRVAIARAIIRDPKILVFDEATSSLDSKNEKEILKSLNQAALGRTTIAVAHRLSTIANSDIIFVLNEGKITEQGTHSDLLKKKGLYARLWDIQAHQNNGTINEQ